MKGRRFRVLLALFASVLTTGILSIEPAEASKGRFSNSWRSQNVGRYKHSRGKKFKKNKHSRRWNKRSRKCQRRFDQRFTRANNRGILYNNQVVNRNRNWRGNGTNSVLNSVTGNILRTGYGNGAYGGHPVHGYNHPGHGAYHPVYGVQNTGAAGVASNLLYGLF